MITNDRYKGAFRTISVRVQRRSTGTGASGRKREEAEGDAHGPARLFGV